MLSMKNDGAGALLGMPIRLRLMLPLQRMGQTMAADLMGRKESMAVTWGTALAAAMRPISARRTAMAPARSMTIRLAQPCEPSAVHAVAMVSVASTSWIPCCLDSSSPLTS